MKALKFAMAAVAAFAFGNAYAFHNGGVAECEGCHVMHNASGGQSGVTTFAGNTDGGKASAIAPFTNVTNAYLLQGTDQSSTCLMCHGAPAGSQYHIADFLGNTATAVNLATLNYTPGGDFSWVVLGERNGHNVVAADFSMSADALMTTAAGGTFAPGSGKAAFACSSCHDPHGRYRLQADTAGAISITGPSTVGVKLDPIVDYGSYGAAPVAGAARGVYRILGGKGYAPASNPAFPFPNDPPIAVAPRTYNQAEGTNEVVVAYGAGMSEWCQNCHTNVHLDGYISGAAGLRHPAGSGAFFRQVQADIYNKYVSSGDLSSQYARYTSLVPFEVGIGKEIQTGGSIAAADYARLAGGAMNTWVPGAADNALLTASTSSNVMCLSCHRAHGTGFASMTRWDNGKTFLALNRTRTAIEWTDKTRAGYYGRSATATPAPTGTDIAMYQRSLCNKCHAKD
jgi:hypothetical protein